jgi:transcriptional regulator with XRE-family HTH domain
MIQDKVGVRLVLKVKHDMLLSMLELYSFTQDAFAKRVNVTYGTVSSWVNLRSSPGSKHHAKIEEVLRIPFEQLWPEWFIVKIRQGIVTHHEVSKLVTPAQLEQLSMRRLESAQNPEQLLIESETVEKVHTLLDRLDPRTGDIIKRRFGVEGERQTVEKISKDLNVSRGRIFQLERIGMSKLEAMANHKGG